MATFSLNPGEQIKKYGALTTGEAATGLRSLEQPITTTPTPTLTPPAPLAPTPTPSLAPNPALSSLTPEQRLAYDASIAKSATSEAALGGALMTGTPAPTPATSPTSTPSGTTVPSGTNILSQEQLDNIYKLAADIGAKGGEYASSDVNSIVLRATGQSLYDLSKVSPELADSIIASLSPIALGKREEGVVNIENQRAETERKQFEERMRADQESRQKQQEATRVEEGIRQMQERASVVSGLARTGSLYTTTAGGFQPGGEIDIEGPGSIVGDLKRRNEYELSMYRMKLEDESRKFNEAMQDGNAALANVHSQNLKDIESDFYNRRQQQTKDLIDARNQILDINKGLKAEAQDEMATFIKAGREAEITPGYLEGIEKQIGAPRGWGQSYLDVTKKQVQLEQFAEGLNKEKLELEVAKDRAELINATPFGKAVSIGNNVYYGLNKGNIVEGVEINKITGMGTYWQVDRLNPTQPKVVSIGQIGTPGEGLQFGFNKGVPFIFNATKQELKWLSRPASLEGGGQKSTLQQMLDMLNASKNDAGFADPDVYALLKDKIRASGTKEVRQFETVFPPEEYLDPKSPKAQPFFQTPRGALTDLDDGNPFRPQ